MSTFQVNTTLDTAAVNLRSGKDATGHISMRSAIMAANARGGSNTIKLRNGTYIAFSRMTTAVFGPQFRLAPTRRTARRGR